MQKDIFGDITLFAYHRRCLSAIPTPLGKHYELLRSSTALLFTR